MQLPAESGRLVLTLRDKQAAAVAPNVGVLRIVNGSFHFTDLSTTQKEKEKEKEAQILHSQLFPLAG